MNDRIRKDSFEEEGPPLFPSWSHWYLLVLTFLAAFIVFLYLFTKAFE
ncbi:MAG TPA: hypothetical protein VKE92_07800 [Anaerolineales bacterium]|nr:hypothetical protein [Anaerolineales bacterium]